MNILMSVNKKFLENAEEMMFSLLYYSSEYICLYLMYLENEISEDDIKHISEFVSSTGKGKIIPLKFDTTKINEMPVDDGDGNFFGLEAYSRIFCAFLLPNEVEKIVYFDADMICTGDIKEIYDIELGGKTWGACMDLGIMPKDLERLRLPKNYHYINSGMLLINVKKIKENYTELDMVNLIKKYQKILIYPDQDFINVAFQNDIKIIDSKYNLLAKCIRYNELIKKPLVIHYAGSTKPWNDDVSRFEIEYIEPYYKVLELQGGRKKDKLKKMLEKHRINGYNNL